MGNLVAFGDHNATKSLHDFYGAQKSFPGLPVNDICLLRAAEHCFEHYNIVFWVNSYPLMGAEALIKYPQYLKLPPETRIVPYHKMPQERGFYYRESWKDLSQKQMGSVVGNYFEMHEYLMGKFSEKFIILPIAAYIFDRILDLNLNIYTRLLEYNWRMVDLSGLDRLSNQRAFTEKNTLTEEAYQLIKPKIFEFIP